MNKENLAIYTDNEYEQQIVFATPANTGYDFD